MTNPDLIKERHNTYFNLLQNIKNEKALVLLMIDAMDIYTSFIPKLDTLIGNNPVWILVNKSDLYPKDLKLNKTSTFEKIYDTVKRIPKGKVASYGTIAALSGNPRWARVVGYALHSNPEPITMPCHRVVTKDGRVSVAFAFGGENMQRLLLAEEGIEFLDDGRVDMKKYGWMGY
jgi:methylated-DNA-protein-cysteine methyltransferase-like protein